MARGNNKISSSTSATSLKISKRYWLEVQEFSSLRFGELLSWFIGIGREKFIKKKYFFFIVVMWYIFC